MVQLGKVDVTVLKDHQIKSQKIMDLDEDPRTIAVEWAAVLTYVLTKNCDTITIEPVL